MSKKYIPERKVNLEGPLEKRYGEMLKKAVYAEMLRREEIGLEQMHKLTK